MLLDEKLQWIVISVSTISWNTYEFTDRPQFFRLGVFLSNAVVSDTGVRQGTVLSSFGGVMHKPVKSILLWITVCVYVYHINIREISTQF